MRQRERATEKYRATGTPINGEETYTRYRPLDHHFKHYAHHHPSVASAEAYDRALLRLVVANPISATDISQQARRQVPYASNQHGIVTDILCQQYAVGRNRLPVPDMA